MKELEGQAEGEENRRYDLYIVSENLEEEQKEEKTGHLNQCFTNTEEEERPSDYTALSRATTAVGRRRGEELRAAREGRFLTGRTADKYKEDQEPACFPVFRWALMVTGVLLLIAVLLILCQLGMEFSQKYREEQEESDLSTQNQTASNSPEMPNSQR